MWDMSHALGILPPCNILLNVIYTYSTTFSPPYLRSSILKFLGPGSLFIFGFLKAFLTTFLVITTFLTIPTATHAYSYSLLPYTFAYVPKQFGVVQNPLFRQNYLFHSHLYISNDPLRLCRYIVTKSMVFTLTYYLPVFLLFLAPLSS